MRIDIIKLIIYSCISSEYSAIYYSGIKDKAMKEYRAEGW